MADLTFRGATQSLTSGSLTPSTNAWVQKNAVLPVPLGYIPTTTIGSLIYTGGGSDITGGILTDTTNSFMYDPVADIISTIAPIPRATGETRALNFNGQMYVMGGGRTAPNPSNEVDIYDPGTDTWSIGIPFVTAPAQLPTDTNGTRYHLAVRRLRYHWRPGSLDGNLQLPAGESDANADTIRATAIAYTIGDANGSA